MLPITQCVAVLACLLFTGAAVYITFVEHPARMTCATSCALSQWAPSYQRATVMQASLAIVARAAVFSPGSRGPASPGSSGRF